MTLPTALVIGPTKCGTTWIHQYLQERGDVCLPSNVKETFYFDHFNEFDVNWYQRFFQHYEPNMHHQIVEVAPTLFKNSDTLPSRVRRELGDIPIVVTLRDPVERLISDYRHGLRFGSVSEDIEHAIENDPDLLSSSFYQIHVSNWKKVFSRVAVLDFRTLEKDPDTFARQIEGILSLPTKPNGEVRRTRVNAAAAPRSIVFNQIVRRISMTMRRLGQDRAINFFKSLGLRKLLYSSEALSPPEFDPDVIERLEMRLADAILWYEETTQK